MTHTSVRSHAQQRTARLSQHRPVTGSKGVSIAPPAYGIDFVDQPQSIVRGMTVQRYSGETSLLPEKQQENRTGLPDHLKAGIESLSGVDLSDVNVHFNSSKPDALQALAYTQGTDIHIAPGQERHLPHEAWHVVQQAQGRVQPTMQLKDGVPVNDEQGLEREADVMGRRALDLPGMPQSDGHQTASSKTVERKHVAGKTSAPIQRKVIKETCSRYMQRFLDECQNLEWTSPPKLTHAIGDYFRVFVEPEYTHKNSIEKLEERYNAFETSRQEAEKLVAQGGAGNQGNNDRVKTVMEKMIEELDTVVHMLNLSELNSPDKPTQAEIAKALRFQTNPWDGAQVEGELTSEAKENRDSLATNFIIALEAQIDAWATVSETVWADWPMMEISHFEGPANAAKKAVDKRFHYWRAAAMVVFPQRHRLPLTTTSEKRNLLDATILEQRETGKRPVDPKEMAEALAEANSACQEVQNKHGFDPKRSQEERKFYNTSIIAPVVTTKIEQLRVLHQYHQNFGDFATGNIFVSPALVRERFDLKKQRDLAERLTLWVAFPMLVHEYIHTLEAPASKAMDNRVILEGFCDMFAQDITYPLLASLPGNLTLMKEVEGDLFDVNGMFQSEFFKDVAKEYVRVVEYEPYVDDAKKIRSKVGDTAVEASYFLGRVEFLGLTPEGKLQQK